MDQSFGPLPPDKEMSKCSTIDLGAYNLVQNVGTRARSPGLGKELAAVHQCQEEENSWLFQMMAKQQKMMLEQMASS